MTGCYGERANLDLSWQVDVSFPKMHFMEAKMGTLRRMFQCASISDDDKYAYCGTKTGPCIHPPPPHGIQGTSI